jgi:hypothetical protein
MQLPREPGLRRRLAYGENLRNRNFFNNFRNLNTNRLLNLNTNILFNFNENKDSGLNVKNLIKNSKIIIYKYNFFCSICQEDCEISNKQDVLILRELICKHSFHIQCIDTWLSNNKSCPICRKLLI